MTFAVAASLLIMGAMSASAQESRGRDLIAASGCVACHDIPGFEGIEFKADALDNAGERLRPEWLRGWLRDPKAHARARMADFRFTASEERDIQAFLLSQQSRPIQADVAWSAADLSLGRKAFDALRCAECHNERPGASSLRGVGAKLRREWVFAFLKDPRAIQPGTPMMKYQQTDSQVRDLAAYVLAEYGSRRGAGGSDAPPVLDKRAIAMGGAAFEARGCNGCHSSSAPARRRKIGPSLLGLAARYSTSSRTRSADISTILAPHMQTRSSRMPAFQFTSEEALAIVRVLLTR